MSVWEDPKHLDSAQQDLFKTPTDEVLANLRVGYDEARRWQTKGWLSFDVGEECELDPPLESELRLISAIARSGLNDALVDELLRALHTPYRYDPELIAYSFTRGWVSPPAEQSPFEVTEENVEEWLTSLGEEGETQRLIQLREHIAELLATFGLEEE